MRPTDVSNPRYYHKVVDCQWACPAHTNVPEYIRLIALGRYTDAYMVNRESNVFPGILGRTCDRPCEPACRRARVDGKPVAICRLKRVAADLRDEFRDRLPAIPPVKNGKRVALVGAGPASLTVCNDLMPLGYECVIFEKLDRSGGLMRVNIPSFRLPASVLDEEVDVILDMGVEVRYSTPVDSMKWLLDQGFDAVFVGSGAPKGKELEIPGRYDTDKIHIGIEWLANVHFGHIDAIGKRVLIIGVGNTAMDCCRTSKRIGATDVKVMARRTRKYFKASPWELEDAEEEQVEIIENHAPKRFVIENGTLVGMEFERLEWTESNGRQKSTVIDTVTIPCDEVILAIGQENAFPWIERDIGIDFGEWDMPVVDKTTFQSTRPGVFFGGDAAWGPENIIWAVEHGHQAAISIHNHCIGAPVTERPPERMNLQSSKLGMHAWQYSNDYSPVPRQKMTHADLEERFSRLTVEVELGFTAEQVVKEVERCLNCDIQTHFTANLCIECDACVDVCPVNCLTITADGDEPDLRTRLMAPAENLTQALYVSEGLPQTKRVMVKDEDICLHCGLCAERCPTAAWDMREFDLLLEYAGMRSEVGGGRSEVGGRSARYGWCCMSTATTPTSDLRPPTSMVNDFCFKIGTVNGTGSASANGLLMQAIFRMGIPVVGKNVFPSNIQGLPTWYEIRVNKDGYTARTAPFDLMVAMNPGTYKRDVADIKQGGWLLYDSSWPMPAELLRDDVTVLGVPLGEMCNAVFSGDRERTLMKNIAYAGALAAFLNIDMDVVQSMLQEKFGKKKHLLESNYKAIKLGYDYARDHYECPLPIRLERMDANQDYILIDGNTAAALGCVYAGATVGAWYPITPATSLMENFNAFCHRFRVDKATGKKKFCIVQAEDELAAAGMVIGAGWMGARAFTPTAGPGISLMGEFVGLAYYAEVPAVFFDVQRTGPSTGMPTRTQQSDLLSIAFLSHGDTKHIALFPSSPEECFYLARDAFDIAERWQTPVFVVSDLDIGMNDWMCRRLQWDDAYRPDRGKVLSAAELEELPKFYRYLASNGDGVAARTLPGVHPKGAYFTRGSGHNKFGGYTEDDVEYREVVDRLTRKLAAAAEAVPAPEIVLSGDGRSGGADVGVITIGSCRGAVLEALDRLRERGVPLDFMRVRAFPFGSAVKEFAAAHERCIVIEQNRDAQLRSLLILETGLPGDRFLSVREYGGLPFGTNQVIDGVLSQLEVARA